MSATPGIAWTPATPAIPKRQRRVVEGFILAEIFFQLALLVPQLNQGPMRVVWRIGVFGMSIAMVALLRGRTRSTPPTIAAIWVMALVGLELFNPTGNTVMAVLAQAAMYLATLGPLFWMSRLNIDLRMFRRTLTMFWGYFSASAGVGILQVLYPGRFQPQLSPVIASMGAMADGLKITLANGARIFRPMGLTDMPGGAATAGIWAVLFGLGFFLEAQGRRRKFALRALYLASMVIGMMCIYLSQTRILMVVVAVWFLCLLLLLFLRNRWREFAALAVMLAVIGGGGYLLSARVGGKQVTQRVSTLAGTSRSAQLLQNDRGLFIRQAFLQFMPQYPLGAGMGRWGMMNSYFGNNSDPARGLIYVEIQWQAWVLDGGIPLVLAYLALLAVTIFSLYRVARRRNPLSLWAALCIAFDVGMIAFSFDYTSFTAEIGLQFWFINTLILTTAACVERQMRREWQMRQYWPYAGSPAPR